jgi:hypothetical protein
MSTDNGMQTSRGKEGKKERGKRGHLKSITPPHILFQSGMNKPGQY